MSEEKSSSSVLKSLFIPCATVFISSFCIMVLELVAGRIIARFLGSSLYTWTSVIGVVLAGITIGNYTGGRLADRFKPVKSLSVLFAICAVVCLITIVLSNFAGKWTWLWQFNWPTRILLHVTMVFLLPSALLGTISPVVAKMALERGLPTGKTVGDIYAWGAAGSIAGTFAAGYYLIGLMGTIPIIYGIAAVMIVMAMLYGPGFGVVRAAAVILAGTAIIQVCPWDWAQRASAAIGLKKAPKGITLYEDETNYCYVAVQSLGGNPEKRVFLQDTLKHSEILVGEPNKLQYTYEQIMAAITHRFSGGKDKPSFMVLGGGGYALPRYLERFWPGGVVEVAEIDPGVTKAAFAAFNLDPKTKINTISLDARNYVDSLIEKKRLGHAVSNYNFIYEDALNDYSVPYQLTTKEFNDKLYKLMTDDGIYMVELIDTFDSALFLGALINTIEQTFPFVTVISEKGFPSFNRNTFVVVAAKHKIDLTDVCKGFDVDRNVWYLSDTEITQLRRKSNSLVLTDNYAPVENLLAPVALRNVEMQSRKFAEQAEHYARKGNAAKAMQKLEALRKTSPSKATIKAYGVIAFILASSGKTNEAIHVYQTALEQFTDTQYKNQIPGIRYSYATLLKKCGEDNQAAEQLDIVKKTCQQLLEENPDLAEPHAILGRIMVKSFNYAKAAEHFKKAATLQPGDIENHLFLIQSLSLSGQKESAVQAAQSAIEYFTARGREKDAQGIKEYIKRTQSQNTYIQQDKK